MMYLFMIKYVSTKSLFITAEAVLHRYSYKNLFWNEVANLQDNTHAEVWFQ